MGSAAGYSLQQVREQLSDDEDNIAEKEERDAEIKEALEESEYKKHFNEFDGLWYDDDGTRRFQKDGQIVGGINVFSQMRNQRRSPQMRGHHNSKRHDHGAHHPKNVMTQVHRKENMGTKHGPSSIRHSARHPNNVRAQLRLRQGDAPAFFNEPPFSENSPSAAGFAQRRSLKSRLSRMTAQDKLYLFSREENMTNQVIPMSDEDWENADAETMSQHISLEGPKTEWAQEKHTEADGLGKVANHWMEQIDSMDLGQAMANEFLDVQKTQAEINRLEKLTESEKNNWNLVEQYETDKAMLDSLKKQMSEDANQKVDHSLVQKDPFVAKNF